MLGGRKSKKSSGRRDTGDVGPPPAPNSKYPMIDYNAGPPVQLPTADSRQPASPRRRSNSSPQVPSFPGPIPPPPSGQIPTPFPAPPPPQPRPNPYVPEIVESGSRFSDTASTHSHSVVDYGLVPSNAPPAYGQVPTGGQVSRIPPMHVAPMKHRPSPSPPQPTMWTPPPPMVTPADGMRPKKKALIIGCNYKGTPYELQGCIHDAKNVEYMLLTQFGFPQENIQILIDDGRGAARPTRSNIFTYFRWLVQDVQPGDSLFFHFSGHGSQKPDHTGDERDGLNETLLPCDFQSAGQIIDDEINNELVHPLPRGAYLHAIIDACHSGTAMDLEFYTKLKGGNIEWRSEGPTRLYKGTSGGIAILFSACADSQVAQDTDDLSGSVHTGAATHAFIEAVVRNGPRISYAQVLSHMHVTMEKLTGRTASTPGLGGKIVDKLTNTVLSFMGIPHQTPQLSCNVRFNLNETLHV